MLRVCVLDFQGQWSKHLPLIEFSYNNSYQATIWMAPYEAVKQIQQKIGTAQSRQKSYSYQRRRMLEFSIGNQVFLKVAPMKGVMRFGKKENSIQDTLIRFIFFERIGDVAYRFDLLASMSQEPVELKADLSYKEIPVEILLREVKKLVNKEISLVKVLENQSIEDAHGK
ncbi:hypothetical protein DH2020_047329 [Rehmannia glutinosa]|uniref:Uncharacterized protein n=1 Tax=Rehmannia glutinosa TaxID=99300 RepID=A0ABR0U8T5_REHGL